MILSNLVLCHMTPLFIIIHQIASPQTSTKVTTMKNSTCNLDNNCHNLPIEAVLLERHFHATALSRVPLAVLNLFVQLRTSGSNLWIYLAKKLSMIQV